jgi:hypothetical protein
MFWNIYRDAVFAGICLLRISPHIELICGSGSLIRGSGSMLYGATQYITGVIYLAAQKTLTQKQKDLGTSIK